MAIFDAAPYLLAIYAVVPLSGFVVTGSWRAALRYTKIWTYCVAAMFAIGLLLTMCVSPP
jgi:hypothetical protein